MALRIVYRAHNNDVSFFLYLKWVINSVWKQIVIS